MLLFTTRVVLPPRSLCQLALPPRSLCQLAVSVISSSSSSACGGVASSSGWRLSSAAYGLSAAQAASERRVGSTTDAGGRGGRAALQLLPPSAAAAACVKDFFSTSARPFAATAVSDANAASSPSGASLLRHASSSYGSVETNLFFLLPNQINILFSFPIFSFPNSPTSVPITTEATATPGGATTEPIADSTLSMAARGLTTSWGVTISMLDTSRWTCCVEHCPTADISSICADLRR